MAKVFMAAYTNYQRDPRVRREAETLVDAGHEVTFMARTHRGDPPRETVCGVAVIRRLQARHKCNAFGEYLIDYLKFFCAILVHLSAHPRRYQLVHINNMPDFLVFSAVLPRLLGIPVIHDIHDLMPELYEEKFDADGRGRAWKLLCLQERWAGRFASLVLTVEDRLVDILSQRGIPREKLRVIMNLPDERLFEPPGSPVLRRVPDRFVLIYHGTLAYRLGLDLAIHAVALCRESIPGVLLRIIGAGEERVRLMGLVETLSLQHHVEFSAGFIPVEEIPAQLAQADIGIIPLRITAGTDIMLPTKLLEYSAMGLPSIVPATGTIRRYFDEDMVQFFEAENVQALARAILTLYHNPERRQSLLRAARGRFNNRFSWSLEGQRYVRMVEHLVAGNKISSLQESTDTTLGRQGVV